MTVVLTVYIAINGTYTIWVSLIGTVAIIVSLFPYFPIIIGFVRTYTFYVAQILGKSKLKPHKPWLYLYLLSQMIDDHWPCKYLHNWLFMWEPLASVVNFIRCVNLWHPSFYDLNHVFEQGQRLGVYGFTQACWPYYPLPSRPPLNITRFNLCVSSIVRRWCLAFLTMQPLLLWQWQQSWDHCCSGTCESFLDQLDNLDLLSETFRDHKVGTGSGVSSCCYTTPPWLLLKKNGLQSTERIFAGLKFSM